MNDIKELLKRILDKYHNRKDDKVLDEFIDEELLKYTKERAKQIKEEIYKELNELYTPFASAGIVADEVLLSSMLYDNVKDLAKQVKKTIKEHLKIQGTSQELAKKLYEGYNFRDKEILKVTKQKALPKYLKEAIESKDTKKLFKEIEKLKTKPLKFAYKKIADKLNEINDIALQKHFEVAYYEKMRYFSNRIAITELERAKNSKRAYEYLNDDEVEFVKYRMSSRHPKMDICDFYANLDVGFGKGVVPKEMMTTLPRHPHCRCRYEPYYKDVKGKKLSWDKAVEKTMSKFSDYEKREILGSKDKLAQFKSGKDIEEIFNSVRPKYPIKRYIDILPKKAYNKHMQKYEENILKRFESFDETEPIESFKRLWVNEKVYDNHLKKRLKENVIKDERDYLIKTFETLFKSDLILDFENRNKNGWNRIHYNKLDTWAVIIGENGDILTSYSLIEEIEEIIEKNRKINIILKRKRNETRIREKVKTILDRLG